MKLGHGEKLTRREFLKLLRIAIIDLALAGIGGAAYSTLIEPGLFRMEQVQLKLKRLPRAFSGLRVVQISDLHMGGWMNHVRLQRVADLVMAQKPDLLLITGDFLLGWGFNEALKQALLDLGKVLSAVAASVPSFAVSATMIIGPMPRPSARCCVCPGLGT
jgi:predicted MPP superfamily phosphohydrolase